LSEQKLSIEEAIELVADALARCRTSPANAQVVARALVAAEADGLKGHGLIRVASYAAQAKIGKIDGYASPVSSRPAPGVIAIDAAHGFAYPALDMVIAELPEIAQTQGIAVAAIRRSHHCGAAGHPVEKLAEQGLVALLFANTPSAIAPWGGSRGLFGTNPIAFSCPIPGASPIIVDMSLSIGTRGAIFAAKKKGERIKEGLALDTEGQPTTDPDEAMKGTMVPVGEAKGTALALMVELLAAGVVGANYAAETSSFLNADGPPPETGQLIIALDPVSIGGETTLSRFADLAAMIEAEPNARLPGERRLKSRAAAKADGLSVDPALIAEIKAL
jgi:(2R)-3-sulfolactate dehydrogenase (NADP+)